MICQFCNSHQATVSIRQVDDEHQVEYNLCQRCIEEKGIRSPEFIVSKTSGNLFAELSAVDAISVQSRAQDSCDRCGLTWRLFQESGIFGCESCYDMFKVQLNQILCKIHGSHQHIGSRPKSHRTVVNHEKLDEIKFQLECAIAEQDFELAAQLRDVVKDTQRQQNQNIDGILR